ncbi:MAG: presenilin family intramembrane aspartyl protease [Patescibacteria group bacterium]|jgi:presenilin-like A22 family membrane protease
MAKFSKTFFIYEAVLFLITQFLGLYLGWRLFQIEEVKELVAKQSYSLWQFLIAFAVGTVVVLFVIKYAKSRIIFSGFFYILIFLGCVAFFDVFALGYLGLGLALLVVILRRFMPSVLTHNLAIILAISGISSYIGLSFLPLQIIIMLVILSIYDFIAVFKTKHMVLMFKKMMENGANLSIIVPNKLIGFLAGMDKAKPGQDFIFLGTGDLAFPIIFAVSVLRNSLLSSILVIAGALLGVMAINIYFYFKKERTAFPALPPITIGCIIGYLVSLFF